ncbi:MAG: hypothetical protein ACI8T1_001189 [Verrucomicrobiales bacterium]|jgi:hypothetical protein
MPPPYTAVFPSTVQFVIVSSFVEPRLAIVPPPPKEALFPVNVQAMTYSLPLFIIAPPLPVVLVRRQAAQPRWVGDPAQHKP